MLFIERLFHISPDNGNGVTEMAILAIVVAGLLLAKATRLLVGQAPLRGNSAPFTGATEWSKADRF